MAYDWFQQNNKARTIYIREIKLHCKIWQPQKEILQFAFKKKKKKNKKKRKQKPVHMTKSSKFYIK